MKKMLKYIFIALIVLFVLAMMFFGIIMRHNERELQSNLRVYNSKIGDLTKKALIIYHPAIKSKAVDKIVDKMAQQLGKQRL